MKVWGIIATILLVVSLMGNLWLYQDYNDLSEDYNSLSHELCSVAYKLSAVLMGYAPGEAVRVGHGPPHISSPSEAVSSIKSNIVAIHELNEDNQRLESENEELRQENQAFKAYIRQVQDEAQKAEKYGMWESLLRLIFSLLI